METLVVTSGRWRHAPVIVARGFFGRWTGLRRLDEEVGLLIRTRSVHGFGMSRRLTVIGLDPEGRVVAVRALDPRRVVTIRAATWMLEIPTETGAPDVGDLLRLARR